MPFPRVAWGLDRDAAVREAQDALGGILSELEVDDSQREVFGRALGEAFASGVGCGWRRGSAAMGEAMERAMQQRGGELHFDAQEHAATLNAIARTLVSAS